MTLDCDPADVELHEHVAVHGVDVEEVARLREQADQLQDAYLRSQREAAHRLAEAGVSRRDAAKLLGISHQRVQQLVAT